MLSLPPSPIAATAGAVGNARDPLCGPLASLFIDVEHLGTSACCFGIPSRKQARYGANGKGPTRRNPSERGKKKRNSRSK